jgi:hypothetical protein
MATGQDTEEIRDEELKSGGNLQIEEDGSGALNLMTATGCNTLIYKTRGMPINGRYVHIYSFVLCRT